MGVLAHNPGGLALYAGLEDWPATQRNLGRYLFLHPFARELPPRLGHQIRHYASRLRALAGIDPDAPDLTRLVGELLLKSPDFAGLWERYEVTGRKAATKTQHPEVGRITLAFQGLALEGTPGQRMGVYTAQPGPPDHDAMVLLDLAATPPGGRCHAGAVTDPYERGAPRGWSVGSAAARQGGALLCQWPNGTGLG